MSTAKQVQTVLRSLIQPGKREILLRFFKTGPGQYGEGDQFLGVVVPDQRAVSVQYRDLPLSELEILISSPIHEYRLTALFILALQFAKADQKTQARLLKFYLAHIKFVNNWDLVDQSAPTIVGQYLLNKPRTLLDRLARSQNLWEKRIAMVATYAFIKQGDLVDTWRLAEYFLSETHDLMHKAVGWMLREAGKRNQSDLILFLDKFATQMPRTMLRYSIEKLSEQQRRHYLKLKVSKIQ